MRPNWTPKNAIHRSAQHFHMDTDRSGLVADRRVSRLYPGTRYTGNPSSNLGQAWIRGWEVPKTESDGDIGRRSFYRRYDGQDSGL